MSSIPGSLDLLIKRPLREIPETDFQHLITEAKAIQYACERSGLQDKSVAIEIGKDNALLSRAKAGQIRLDDAALSALMDCTGCEAPLYAMLLRRGYDPRSLRKLETETEKQLREAHEALEAERTKVRVLTEALRSNA